MSNQDPIELLRQLAPAVQNGNKETLKQAAELVKQLQAEHADLQSAISRQPMPEAGASATFKVVDPQTQLECLFTVRDAPTARLLIKELGAVSAALAEAGFIGFDAYVDQRRAERGQDKPAGQTTGWDKHQGSQHNNTGNSDALTFKAETLEVSISGDKTYYKIKGPKFPQYGVTVWPEVLQDAGFDLDTIARVTHLNGYIAHYTIKEDGKPNKVIGLEPTA